MPRLAANLHTLFTEIPPLERFPAARGSGFDAVELFLVGSLPMRQVRSKLDQHGLTLVQLYADCGAFAQGERGTAIFPDRSAEFRESIDRAIDNALEAGCQRINILAGISDGTLDAADFEATLVGNLAWAAARCAPHHLELLLEPITNQGPRYFIRRTAHARAVIEAVGAANLRMLYDIYHGQVLEGNLTATIQANLDVIGHIQAADVPGRHEPGTGEIRFPFLFDAIDAAGYAGWIGLEYLPSGPTIETLGWAAPYLRREPAGAGSPPAGIDRAMER